MQLFIRSRLGVAIESQDFVTKVSNLLSPGHGPFRQKVALNPLRPRDLVISDGLCAWRRPGQIERERPMRKD